MEQRIEPTGWVGWVYFGGFMMIMMGSLHAIYGLAAILNDQWVVWTNRGSVYFDVSEWGWIHLIAGIILALVGVGVLLGNVIARAVGAIVVGVAFILNFLTMPLYPLWSLVAMAVALLVLWALIVHGDEARA
jgi:hypothetical protein